jgi:hypothetical protein
MKLFSKKGMQDFFFLQILFLFSLLQFIMMTAYSEDKKGLLANFYFYSSHMSHLQLIFGRSAL